MSGINTKLDLIKQFLDMRVSQHSLHAANIANSETPNYKAKTASFESKLLQAEDPTNKTGDEKWKLGIRVGKSGEIPREDGNNVKLEREMGALAENSLLYMTALKIFNKELALERYAITSGGR